MQNTKIASPTRSLSPILTFVLLLTACGGGGGGSSTAESGARLTASVSKVLEVPPSLANAAPFDQPRSLTVPPDFGIRLWARIPKARFMARAPSGDILVSLPSEGKVVLLRERANNVPLQVPGTDTLWVVINNRDDISFPLDADFDGDGASDLGEQVPGYIDDHPPELFTSVRDGGNYGWPFCNSVPNASMSSLELARDHDNNRDGSQLNCATVDAIADAHGNILISDDHAVNPE